MCENEGLASITAAAASTVDINVENNCRLVSRTITREIYWLMPPSERNFMVFVAPRCERYGPRIKVAPPSECLPAPENLEFAAKSVSQVGVMRVLLGRLCHLLPNKTKPHEYSLPEMIA